MQYYDDFQRLKSIVTGHRRPGKDTWNQEIKAILPCNGIDANHWSNQWMAIHGNSSLSKDLQKSVNIEFQKYVFRYVHQDISK